MGFMVRFGRFCVDPGAAHWSRREGFPGRDRPRQNPTTTVRVLLRFAASLPLGASPGPAFRDLRAEGAGVPPSRLHMSHSHEGKQAHPGDELSNPTFALEVSFDPNELPVTASLGERGLVRCTEGSLALGAPGPAQGARPPHPREHLPPRPGRVGAPEEEEAMEPSGQCVQAALR